MFEMKTEAENSEIKSFPNWLAVAVLAVFLIFSEGLYLALLKLNAINGWQPVLNFWFEMALLFALYALAAFLVHRFEGIRKQAFWLIIFGAVLFRITLLPAGIPYELSAAEKFEAMQADLQGTEVTYERFQLFDNDVWRYIWDGHVSAHGINPYLYAPSDTHLDAIAGEAGDMDEWPDEALQTDEGEIIADVSSDETKLIQASVENKDLTDGREIWGDIRSNINYADVTTIYPPLAQFVFWLSHELAPGSLLMMKSLLVICELIGILFLAMTLRRLDLPVTGVILYAWNPLMIKVFAGSGHADAILVAALCAMAFFIVSGWKTFGAAAFGLAILAKLSPVILLPFVVRRIGWLKSLIILAVVFIGYLPFIGAGQNLFAGFLQFAQEWQFNAGTFTLIRWLLESVSDNAADLARQLSGLLIVAVVAVAAWRDDLSNKAFVWSAALILGTAIILSPTVMPWYLSWVLPFAVMARQYVWIYFSALVLAAFHIMIDLNEHAFVLWIEYGLFFALVMGHGWLNRRAFKFSFASF